MNVSEQFNIDDLGGQDVQSTADPGQLDRQDKDLPDQMSELDIGHDDQNGINNNSDEESFDIVQLKVIEFLFYVMFLMSVRVLLSSIAILTTTRPRT